ncbi:zinc finger, CCHC-type containing protein [Tanacetum coccineum]
MHSYDNISRRLKSASTKFALDVNHLSCVVNMVEHNNSSKYNDNKGKRKHHENTRADPNKKAKPTCWKCSKTGHIKRDCKGVNVGNKASGSGTKSSVDGSSNSLKG